MLVLVLGEVLRVRVITLTALSTPRKLRNFSPGDTLSILVLLTKELSRNTFTEGLPSNV